MNTRQESLIRVTAERFFSYYKSIVRDYRTLLATQNLETICFNSFLNKSHWVNFLSNTGKDWIVNKNHTYFWLYFWSTKLVTDSSFLALFFHKIHLFFRTFLHKKCLRKVTKYYCLIYDTFYTVINKYFLILK